LRPRQCLMFRPNHEARSSTGRGRPCDPDSPPHASTCRCGSALATASKLIRLPSPPPSLPNPSPIPSDDNRPTLSPSGEIVSLWVRILLTLAPALAIDAPSHL
jgi:hypothetical protein